MFSAALLNLTVFYLIVEVHFPASASFYLQMHVFVFVSLVLDIM